MITDIRLQHFRSYTDKRFTFTPGVNIIVGPNASGKTNLLEALLVTALGSSYRVKDQELVMFDKPWARLDADGDSGERIIKLVAEPEPTKSYEIDGKPFKRLSLQHSLPVVLFEPNHLRLLHGSPEQRRTYLDALLEQTIPGHGTMIRNYRRVLAQRNALLKRAKRTTNEELFPWNLRLSELGATLARRRADLVQLIDTQIGEQYRLLANNKTKTQIHYQPQFVLEAYESNMLHKLESNLSVDMLRGFTGSGPHREDFVVSFDDHPADETASRGETRTFLLALKVIELELLSNARGVQPLLLLDDVFSELDTSRRHALTEQLDKYQTFITTTDADITVKDFHDKALTISLE